MTPTELKNKLISIPKADLHVHFEGTVYSSGNIPENFDEFIKKYIEITKSIHTKNDVIEIATDYAKSCLEQNIIHSEIYFSAVSFVHFEKDIDEIFIGLKHAQEIAESNYKTKFRWIFDVVRNLPGNGSDNLELALKARELGVDVFAIGLAGDEKLEHVSKYRDVFLKAKALGFKTLAHAGEGTSAKNIKETIEFLNPDRIGHGISALEDTGLCRELKESQIPIEVSPWSNVILNTCPKENHPIAKMIEQGLNITICSDDPGIFGKDLIDNYLLTAELGAGKEALFTIARNSLQLTN